MLFIASGSFAQTKTEDIEIVSLKAHYVKNIENSPLRVVNYFATLNIANKNESCVINFIMAEPFFFYSQDEFDDWYAQLKNTVALSYNSYEVKKIKYINPDRSETTWHKLDTNKVIWFNSGNSKEFNGYLKLEFDTTKVSKSKPSGQGQKEFKTAPDSTTFKMYLSDREYFIKLQETVPNKNQYIGLQWCIDLLNKYIQIEAERLKKEN